MIYLGSLYYIIRLSLVVHANITLQQKFIQFTGNNMVPWRALNNLYCNIPVLLIFYANNNMKKDTTGKYTYNILLFYQYVNNLDFDLSRSLKVKCDGVIEHPLMMIYGFLLLFDSNIWPNSLLYEIWGFEIWVTLTFQGHSRSNVMVPLDSPYMISY